MDKNYALVAVRLIVKALLFSMLSVVFLGIVIFKSGFAQSNQEYRRMWEIIALYFPFVSAGIYIGLHRVHNNLLFGAMNGFLFSLLLIGISFTTRWYPSRPPIDWQKLGAQTLAYTVICAVVAWGIGRVIQNCRDRKKKDAD